MKQKRFVIFSFVGTVGLLIATTLSPVFADKYQDQINELNNQNAAHQGDLGQLGAQAASLQDTIAKMQAEIDNLQAQITATQAKRDETMSKIAKAEADLVQQRQYLSDSLKAMYVDGDISSLEMLASSQNINDFVDQQQYQQSVQGQLQKTLDTIKQLRAQLDLDKSNLDRMIADLNNMQSQVAAQKAEQDHLLNLNQDQQAELDGQIKNNNSKISDLRKQQALDNARLGGGKIPAGVQAGGGYPGVWAYAPMDSLLDSWGMYNRECVSYTAYKVAASGRYMPYWGGYGNANQWDDNARAMGIPVDGNPRQGDVAVSNSGTWGHVMYVEAVASDGSILVSDYNQQYDGLYREYTITAETVRNRGLVFIHF
jgi:surface antigen